MAAILNKNFKISFFYSIIFVRQISKLTKQRNFETFFSVFFFQSFCTIRRLQ